MSDITKECILKNGKLLTLRNSQLSDARQILDYLNMVGGESDNLMFGKNGYMHMTVAQEAEYLVKLDDSPNTLSLVGFVEGRLVSLSQVRGEPPLRAAHNFELSITVAKEFWGIGVGSAAMAEMIRFAKEHGGRIIHLGVRAGNDAAISLYKKFGFKKAGVHRDFFNINGNYYDEILMDLFLA
jgi:RimJ/RimL family protein N-acetyltransferase